jgi:hypothetical protein
VPDLPARFTDVIPRRQDVEGVALIGREDGAVGDETSVSSHGPVRVDRVNGKYSGDLDLEPELFAQLAGASVGGTVRRR